MELSYRLRFRGRPKAFFNGVKWQYLVDGGPQDSIGSATPLSAEANFPSIGTDAAGNPVMVYAPPGLPDTKMYRDRVRQQQ